MDETRLILENQQIFARLQELTNWVLVIVSLQGFASMVLLALGAYFLRGTRETLKQMSETTKQVSETTKQVSETLKQVSETTKRVAELVERQGYYLFTKFGPADTR
jgi:methyl-accepting chemotaxis protein